MDVYPAMEFYQRISKKRIRQGDIAIGEFTQIRNRSGEPLGPGPETVTEANLPFLGEYTNHELKLTAPEGREVVRVLRVWRGPVMVLHQNCEIDFANEQDSRLIVAPLVSRALWPEGPWDFLTKNQLPGYFYLPGVSGQTAEELELPNDFVEAAVVLASATCSSVGLVKSFRLLSLSLKVLPSLQDSISKFFAVRGFGSERELKNVVGKEIVKVVDTGQSVAGPSKLIKAYFGPKSADPDDEDELTVVNFGVRP